MLLSVSMFFWRSFVLLSWMAFSFSEVWASGAYCQGVFEGEYLPAKDALMHDGIALNLPVFVGSGHIAKTMVLRNQQQLEKELSVLQVKVQILETKKADPLFSRSPALKLVLTGKSKHLYRALRYMQDSQILKKEEFVEARERLLENQLSPASVQNLRNYLALEKLDAKVQELLRATQSQKQDVVVYLPLLRTENIQKFYQANTDFSFEGLRFKEADSKDYFMMKANPLTLYRFLKTLEFKDLISVTDAQKAFTQMMDMMNDMSKK